MSIKNKDFMTSREAAAELGVALSTIQLWANNGLLNVWKTSGGHRRIARSSVEAILSQQRNAMAGEPNVVEPVVADDLQGKQFTVVVVEDLPVQRRLYEQQFAARDLPIQLIMAKNGYEGLIQIGHHMPEVIITDLMMPNMDGFQMIAALKEAPELGNSLMIVVSGLTKEEINDRGGLPNDVMNFIKPIPFDELETVLRQQITSRKKVA